MAKRMIGDVERVCFTFHEEEYHCKQLLQHKSNFKEGAAAATTALTKSAVQR